MDEKKIPRLERPFRMGKINSVWEKAQKKLSDQKLKKIYGELKVIDKQELALKKVKSEGGDKDGLKEAGLRKELNEILQRYGMAMLHNFEPQTESPTDKNHQKIFKDKKLQKLWEKAQRSGLTDEELGTLKEEFMHHEDKLNSYYSLLDSAEPQNDYLNDLENSVNKYDDFETLESVKVNFKDKAEVIREKNREIKKSFDRLEKRTHQGPNADVDFVEPRVRDLWKLAMIVDFPDDELHSLKTELQHFEHRILKLEHMKDKMAVHSNDDKYHVHEKHDEQDELKEKIKRQNRIVEKMHKTLEERITMRHVDL